MLESVDCGNGVTLDKDSMTFWKKVDDKKFTCKSYEGLMSQVDNHVQNMEERESLREDLIEVQKLHSDDIYLYHPALHHIYISPESGNLRRISVTIADQYFSVKDRDKALELKNMMDSVTADIKTLNEKARKLYVGIQEAAVYAKPYKTKEKKRGEQMASTFIL